MSNKSFWVMAGMATAAVGLAIAGNKATLNSAAELLAINGPAKQAAFGVATLNIAEVKSKLQDSGNSELFAMASRVEKANVPNGEKISSLLSAMARSRQSD